MVSNNIFTLKRHLSRYNLPLLVIISFLSGCDTDQKLADPIPQHKNYVNLSTGMERVYEVDSLYYDNFQETIDTYHYTVTETVGKQIDSNRYRMRWQLKSSNSGIKEKGGLFSAKMKNSQFEVFRDNQRLVKMSFPVEKGKTWDGNSFNSKSATSFRYENTHEPYSNDNFDFDSTVTVVEKDQGNLIEQQTRKVVYTKGIGKVFKEELNLRYKGDSIPPKDVAWEKKANTGYLIRYELKNYRLP